MTIILPKGLLKIMVDSKIHPLSEEGKEAYIQRFI